MIRRKVVIAAVAALVLAGAALIFGHTLLASGEAPAAATSRDRMQEDEFPSAIRERAEALGFDTATSRKISPGTYLVEKKSGQLCLVSTAKGMRGGCNSKATFFHGEPAIFGISEEGAPSAPTSVRIAGVARPEIRLVRAHFGAVAIDATPSEDGGFVIEATAQALSSGPPSTLDAFRENGTLVKTYDLPQS